MADFCIKKSCIKVPAVGTYNFFQPQDSLSPP